MFCHLEADLETPGSMLETEFLCLGREIGRAPGAAVGRDQYRSIQIHQHHPVVLESIEHKQGTGYPVFVIHVCDPLE